MASDPIALFWPGDARPRPNDLARPAAEDATVQLEKALDALGRSHYRIEGFVAKPHESLDKLGPVDDPMIGVCVHWFYGPHTTDGTVGKDNPLLLASNFSGQWPGLVGLLNTGACLTSLGRQHSRVWTEAEEWAKDSEFMDRLGTWCRTGRIPWSESEVAASASISHDAAGRAQRVAAQFRERKPLILMLGDTSMGMINGYFGPRVLHRVGFTEHKVDQAQLLHLGPSIDKRRIDDALAFVKDRGVVFHWGEALPGERDASDFTEETTREQLRDYLVVQDLLAAERADCLGWQYQLGLIPLRPPSDFAEGLFNSTCRPESNGHTVTTATEADQGNVVAQEMMKRLLQDKGVHEAVFFHDVRWGAEHDGRFLWVLLNSGSSGAFAFNHDPDTLRGVHSYRQPSEYFPAPGGSFAGESLPGEVTWARAWLDGDRPRMDVGRGEVVQLPPEVRDRWWNGTTRQWPFMAADLGIGRDTLMAHYQSNHVAVCYGDIFGEMVALSRELGFDVRVFGRRPT